MVRVEKEAGVVWERALRTKNTCRDIEWYQHDQDSVLGEYPEHWLYIGDDGKKLEEARP